MLQESVLEGLEALGRDLSKVILFHIERRRGIGQDVIAERVEEFVRALEEIFGLGSLVIEKMILERLNRRAHLLPSLEKGDWSLLDYMTLLEAQRVSVGR